PRDRIAASTKDLCFRSSARRYLRQRSSFVTRILDVVDPFVCRLERNAATLSRNLQGLTARCRRFPDLTGSRAVRCEINPLPIVRPTRSSVRSTSAGNLARHTTSNSDGENTICTLKDHLLVIRRPACSTPSVSCDLRRVRAIGIAYPNLPLA